MNESNLISIDDFAKVSLKVGVIIEATKVEKSNKLLVLKVKISEDEIRQVVSGIAKSYSPEELINKEIVIICNLQPASLMGIESQGMLLAASNAAGELSLISPEKIIGAGSQVR